ncbi:MAG TPA: ABC transporter ATP-binding protein, partial [Trueperaceae bacterium]|nr:ABC transporter ATP-binding protein [Trueperaceae bacterium]
ARAVDRYIIANQVPFNSLDIDQRLSGLLLIVLIYIALKVLNFALRYGYTYLISWLGQHIIFDIRKEMFKKIQSMHLGYFDKTPVGRLITRITSDVDAVQRMITDGLVGLIADLGLLVGLAVYMLVINWQLALITISVMPILFFVMNFISNQIRNAYRAMRIRLSRSNAYLAENLSGMKTVQLFNRESRNQQKFDKLNLSLLDSQLEQLRWFAYFFPVVQFTGSIATGLILILSVYMLGLGNGTITIGIIIAFIQYSSMFFQPLRDLSDKINIMQAAMASSERIFSLLDTPAGIINKPDPSEFVSPFRGKIEFKNVSFAYNDDDWVLRDLNFTINPGESAAFVGHTGAGKTTIISLVSRFYDVQKGQILLDDIDIRDYEQRDLRKHVGIVLQDPFLFSGTIKSNISLDDDSIAMEQIIEAAKFVNAHTFISKLPQGYDTPVLERGAGFSTGQKQLIAFARTLVQNPDILLILDEATANIDTETEELIQDALKKIMQGRTSIVIAHRLSTIQNVDKIMVMSKGKLIEQGKHLELLKQDGYYRKLYELQYQ